MAAGSSDEQSDSLLQEAIDWLIRLEDAPHDADLRRAVEAWKAADARHLHAWQRAQRSWQLLGEVSPDAGRWPMVSGSAPGDTAQPRRRRRRRGRRVATAVAASVAACVVVALWPFVQHHVLTDYATSVGEIRQVRLDDGSVVHLGADSAIDTDYGDGYRRVHLVTGQAFFEVASDPQRPFVVRAGGLDVTVLGTAFDVQRTSRSYIVGVQHGAVAVRYQGAHRTVERQLAPGEQLRIARGDGSVALEPIAPGTVAAWRHGRLFVHERSVADVVETLQRYYHGRILVPDRALAERRVTGSYRLDDLDRALRGLVQPHDGRVQELTPLLRIVRDH